MSCNFELLTGLAERSGSMIAPDIGVTDSKNVCESLEVVPFCMNFVRVELRLLPCENELCDSVVVLLLSDRLYTMT